jgi:hydrogenase nickel incorporation protein HypB
MNVVTIERKILEKNDAVARKNRESFDARRIYAINLVSSPGSGKTTLVERTLEQLRKKVRIAVIEGDVQTDLDAQRVSAYGVPTVQIVTNGGCHLEANLVSDALAHIDLDGIELLIIENVGNLVCPANYDLGEAAKVVVLSVTEGDDKPLKYPAMFRHASALVVNKIDLLPYLRCSIDALIRNALEINPRLQVFRLSAVTGEGVESWTSWLAAEASRSRKEIPV